jgi:hypothetical protein
LQYDRFAYSIAKAASMNTQPSSKLWLALSLLGIEYALLGWYLAAHHIFWLVSAFIVATTVAVAWKNNPLLEFVTWLSRQQIVIVIGVSLLLSLVLALTLARPILLSLIPLPLITLLYAHLEMRALEFSQTETFVWLVVLATLALGLGEAVDLFVAPSMRY